MEWVLVALLVGGFALAGRRWWRGRADAAEAGAELDGARRLVEEDVAVLGEQLRQLDGELAGHELHDATRVDYQRALDAYESAGRSAPLIRTTDEIRTVVDTLSAGRHALACVEARVAGRPVPERQVPCFFDPQHGPSVREVLWTPLRGGGTRLVPACAPDASRVLAHEEPEVRTVVSRSRRVPYWEASMAYQAYVEGYFLGSVVMSWVLRPPVEAGAWPGPGDGGSGGPGGGFDGGGFDGADGGGGGGGGD